MVDGKQLCEMGHAPMLRPGRRQIAKHGRSLTLICSGPQTVSGGLAHASGVQPTIRANMRGCQPTRTANERRFIANSSIDPHSMQTAREGLRRPGTTWSPIDADAQGSLERRFAGRRCSGTTNVFPGYWGLLPQGYGLAMTRTPLYELHREELIEDWLLAEQRKPLKRIAPLE
jgi:hypothetical protein